MWCLCICKGSILRGRPECNIIFRGVTNDGNTFIVRWEKASPCFTFDTMESIDYESIAKEIVEYKLPVSVFTRGVPLAGCFVIVNGFSGILKQDEDGSYDYSNVSNDMLKVADPYKGESKTLQQALSKGQEISTVRRIRSKPE